MLRRSLFLAAAVVLFAGTASAATVKFHATLTAGAEVPPSKSTGSGEADMTLDTTTHELTWEVTFKGFSSEVVAAHIHGPAQPGANAGVVIAFPKSPTSPIKGSAKLTDGTGTTDGRGVLREHPFEEQSERGGARAVD